MPEYITTEECSEKIAAALSAHAEMSWHGKLVPITSEGMREVIDACAQAEEYLAAMDRRIEHLTRERGEVMADLARVQALQVDRDRGLQILRRLAYETLTREVWVDINQYIAEHD